MTEFDRAFLRSLKIVREERPTVAVEKPLCAGEAEIHGYRAPDGSMWVPYGEVEALIGFNGTLYQQAVDYKNAATRWCREAGDASRRLRGARATVFMLAGLIFAMGVVHALLG